MLPHHWLSSPSAPRPALPHRRAVCPHHQYIRIPQQYRIVAPIKWLPSGWLTKLVFGSPADPAFCCPFQESVPGSLYWYASCPPGYWRCWFHSHHFTTDCIFLFLFLCLFVCLMYVFLLSSVCRHVPVPLGSRAGVRVCAKLIHLIKAESTPRSRTLLNTLSFHCRTMFGICDVQVVSPLWVCIPPWPRELFLSLTIVLRVRTDFSHSRVLFNLIRVF